MSLYKNDVVTNDICNIRTYEQLKHITDKCEKLGICLAFPINGHAEASYLLKTYIEDLMEFSIWIENNSLYWTGKWMGISYENYIEKNPCMQ